MMAMERLRVLEVFILIDIKPNYKIVSRGGLLPLDITVNEVIVEYIISIY